MRRPVFNWAWAVFVLTISFAGTVGAEDLPRARPEEVGFSTTRLEYLDQFYADRVEKGELAGIVVLISRHGRVAHFSAVGYANVETKQKLTLDSLFRLYSMTKPIASVALMILHEEGRFQVTDPVSKYLPEFVNLRVLRDPDGAIDDSEPAERAPTIQDVLRHTAGFSHGLLSDDAYDAQYANAHLFDPDISLPEMMTRLSKIPLRYQPGTKFAYSVGPDVQARLVEVLSGMPFDQFLEKRLLRPLGMRDTAFRVPADNARRLAAVHTVKDGKLVAEHWESDSHIADHRRKGGSYGLVSTAGDYWRFAQMLLNGGELDGVRILGPRTVRYMTRDHLGTIDVENPDGRASGMGWGLGFTVTKDPVAAGSLLSEGTFYHGGAAATFFWCDPAEDLAIVAMTQHLSVPGVEMLWTQIPTLVYSALVD